jgi:hypothetical protein
VVFLALNENNFSPRVLYPAKQSFKIDRAIKILFSFLLTEVNTGFG